MKIGVKQKMEELDLRELFRNFWSKKVQIILVIAIFVVLGFMYSYIFLEPSYQSVTSILLAKSNTSNAENEGSITTTDIIPPNSDDGFPEIPSKSKADITCME